MTIPDGPNTYRGGSFVQMAAPGLQHANTKIVSRRLGTLTPQVVATRYFSMTGHPVWRFPPSRGRSPFCGRGMRLRPYPIFVTLPNSNYAGMILRKPAEDLFDGA